MSSRGKASNPETIAAIIVHAFGAPAVWIQRLTSGEVNEVYRVSLEDGQDVILRISHDDEDTFTGEAWAIGQSAQVGVPVADVLGMGDVPRSGVADGSRYMIQESIPGTLLSSIITQEPVNSERSHTLAHRAGEVLARIHTIPTEGFGYLENGRGSYPDKIAWMQRMLDQEERYTALLTSLAIPHAGVNSVFSLLREAGIGLTDAPHLLHGDFTPRNILIGDGDTISGVIDFEEAASGDTALDFAIWAFLQESLLAALVAGYSERHPQVMSKDFGHRLRLMCVYKGLHMLHYYAVVAGRADQACAIAQKVIECAVGADIFGAM